jgi:hypothetical protein
LALAHVQIRNVVQRKTVAFAYYVGYILCDACTTRGFGRTRTK